MSQTSPVTETVLKALEEAREELCKTTHNLTVGYKLDGFDFAAETVLESLGHAQTPAVPTDDILNPDERPQTLLRKWADVLDIPSGDFVNSDLRAAADHIDQVEAEAWKYLQEAGRLARLMALSDTSTDCEGK